MAITLQTITDNPHIYEAVIIGSAGGDTQTIDVSGLFDSVEINGADQQRLDILIEYSLDPNCMLSVELASDMSGSFTSAEYWNGYGTGKIFIKNSQTLSNGDIKIAFVGAAGCCKVSANKTEGFRLASPYYRKVSNRRA